jgi:hypothetical protein
MPRQRKPNDLSQKSANTCAIRSTRNRSCWRETNEVSSWDITKLMGPAKWAHFYLYFIGIWCVADRESATLFRALFNGAIAKRPCRPAS